MQEGVRLALPVVHLVEHEPVQIVLDALGPGFPGLLRGVQLLANLLVGLDLLRGLLGLLIVLRLWTGFGGFNGAGLLRRRHEHLHADHLVALHKLWIGPCRPFVRCDRQDRIVNIAGVLEWEVLAALVVVAFLRRQGQRQFGLVQPVLARALVDVPLPDRIRAQLCDLAVLKHVGDIAAGCRPFGQAGKGDLAADGIFIGRRRRCVDVRSGLSAWMRLDGEDFSHATTAPARALQCP